MKAIQIIALSVAATMLLAQSDVASSASRHFRPHLATHAKPLARSAPTIHNPTLAHHEEGDDDATAISLDPSLSALCQSYIGQLNVYHDPRPNVDVISHDATVNVGSQTGCKSAQNETTIAVNPENPLNLVAGSNDYRVFNTRENRNDGSGFAYTTFDGGRTWLNVQLPHLTFQTGATGALSDMDSAGDPAIAFGPHNTVYYANLVFSRLNAGSGIVVSKSVNGGRTWSEPSIVRLDGVDANGNPLDSEITNDKEWITVDQRTGAIYVTWTRFGPDETGFDGSPIVVSRSTDGGKTWSKFATVNPASSFTNGGVTPYSQGSNPQVGRHGELYIAYEAAVCQTLDCDQATDHDAIVVATSYDGGQTFSNTEVAPDFDFPFDDDVQDAVITGENFRMNSFPQMALDPVTNKLYITWADDRNGAYDASGNSIKTNGDVFVVASFDGVHWTDVKQIGTKQDEVYPAIAAYGGQVAVSFYTRHYDPKGIGLDFAAVHAFDFFSLSGLAHAPLLRLTRESENPQVQFVGVGAVTGNVLQGVFIGDYTAIAMGRDGVFHPCWTDFRGDPGVTSPNQDVYTQAIFAAPEF